MSSRFVITPKRDRQSGLVKLSFNQERSPLNFDDQQSQSCNNHGSNAAGFWHCLGNHERIYPQSARSLRTAIDEPPNVGNITAIASYSSIGK
ncbi:hypothetical protein [Microcoleus sp. Pol17_C1]|uniref:hypothetical protein n=1 Tax=unclassified Microcoleus TaxID=2642155 RepID=UPI002FD2C95D